MAARHPRALLALGLALLATAAAAATDPFLSQLGDTAGCRGQCGRSLPRRAAADAVLNACYRGCRLFSICHFVDASAELNTTRAECEAACAEAYSNTEEQFGCVTGCRKQLPEVESRREKSLELKEPSFSMLDLVSTFCNDIVSSAQSFISSTWTFYLQADDGKVVVFQSQPEMEYPVSEVQETQPERPGRRSSPHIPQPHTGPRVKGEKPLWKEPRGKAKGQHTDPPPAGARLPRLHVQALGPSSLDPGRLPLPLHHGDAVAELCQFGDGPRAAHQDPASEHQRGQGVPGGPGWPWQLPPATRHRCHPVPHAWRRGRGAAAPQSRPRQDHPVALPPFLSPPRHRPCHYPSGIVPSSVPLAAPCPQLPEGHLWLWHGGDKGDDAAQSHCPPWGQPLWRRLPGAGQRLCLLRRCAVCWDPGFQKSCQSWGSPSLPRGCPSPPDRSPPGGTALRAWVQHRAGGSRLPPGGW
ncbi:Tmem59l [Columba livia]|nr:Tmem59l [Columba livia]